MGFRSVCGGEMGTSRGILDRADAFCQSYDLRPPFCWLRWPVPVLPHSPSQSQRRGPRSVWRPVDAPWRSRHGWMRSGRTQGRVPTQSVDSRSAPGPRRRSRTRCPRVPRQVGPAVPPRPVMRLCPTSRLSATPCSMPVHPSSPRSWALPVAHGRSNESRGDRAGSRHRTTVAEARDAERAGADAVIAQGMEAGGHRGAFDP